MSDGFQGSGGQDFDRRPPWSPQAEVSVLGGMFIDRDAVARAVEILDPSMFYREAHRRVFRGMSRLFERGEVVDVITLGEEMRKTDELEGAGGLDYLAELLEMVPTAANIEYHARIVREKALLRRLIEASQEIIRDAFDQGEREVNELLDQAEARIFQVAQTQEREGFVRIKDLLWPAFEEIERLQTSGSPITGVPSGFPDLDRMTTGLQKGDLCIVAARPSMGKTSWVLNVAATAAIEHEAPVAIFSLEMSKEQLLKRLLSAEARVDAQHIRRGGMSPDESQRLGAAAGHLNNAPIWIDDSPGMSVLEMRAKARRLASDVQAEGKRLGMVVVDYLQLMGGDRRTESRVQEVSQISRGLKALARELDVPLVALSQLSRAPEQRNDKRPMLSDLRESGSIEQDADLVMFLFRPEYYFGPVDENGNSIEGKAELIVSKQRNGPTGVVQLHFHKAYTRFDSAQRDDVGPQPEGPGY
ncbi:MAG: replicative DNA helicase [Gemmatimonadetes bacterium]|nr:replicative DNA helicase [Gemmatimonadota bacterium]NNF39568.1 replicative DNA helicase [Gemmatimonadota bacterium]NNK62147.1 replicative DNA helicase [Gemmatimonadota bacterium]